MLTTRTLLAATTLTVAAALPAASALAASTPFPSGQRPHSRIVTYDHGDVLVRRLQMSLTRKDHVLHGQVRLTVRNETGQTLHRVLRVGPCVGGPTGYPNCNTDVSIPVRIPAHVDVPIVRSVTLHQPPASIDSVQAALVKAGARQPYAIRGRSGASLLLRGNAWRGKGAGRLYGVAFHSDDARRLSFDIPAENTTRAYIDVVWTGSAAPRGVPTTISRCTGATCTAAALPPTNSRSGPQKFGRRFDYAIAGADALGLSAGPAGKPLFDAELPWPG
jgi:hypothetical protein